MADLTASLTVLMSRSRSEIVTQCKRYHQRMHQFILVTCDSFQHLFSQRSHPVLSDALQQITEILTKFFSKHLQRHRQHMESELTHCDLMDLKCLSVQYMIDLSHCVSRLIVALHHIKLHLHACFTNSDGELPLKAAESFFLMHEISESLPSLLETRQSCAALFTLNPNLFTALETCLKRFRFTPLHLVVFLLHLHLAQRDHCEILLPVPRSYEPNRDCVLWMFSLPSDSIALVPTTVQLSSQLQSHISSLKLPVTVTVSIADLLSQLAHLYSEWCRYSAQTAPEIILHRQVIGLVALFACRLDDLRMPSDKNLSRCMAALLCIE